ncbi:MAG: hypothetical protein WDA60_02920 [Acidimicrobiia bacterium]
MKRGFGVFACLVVAAVPTDAAFAGSEDESAPTGSLAAQLAVAMERSLGGDATTAVLQGYDRGYEPVQMVEASFDGGLRADGTITEDGAPVKPFRPPSNVIDATNTSKIERGVAKTTKRIDKLVDLAERTKRFDVGDDAFVALIATALMVDGYSPEQIILDGFMSDGILLEGEFGAWTGVKIVDGDGKTVRPDGVLESEETKEAADALDQLAGGIVDLVGGLDPRLATTEKLRSSSPVLVVIEFTRTDGDRWEIRAGGEIGVPKDRGLKGFLAGTADGSVDVVGNCGIGSTRVPISGTGDMALGLAGPVAADAATVRIAVTEVSLGGSVPSQCLHDEFEIAEEALKYIDFGPVEVGVRAGAPKPGTSTAPFSYGDATGTVRVEVHD